VSRVEPSFLIGSDIGTSSCKSVLMDRRANVVAMAIREYPSLRPKPTWVEQNPEDWYGAFIQTIRELLHTRQADPRHIVAVAIVGVTHNPVLLDEKGVVLRPAIHFWDRRSIHQAEDIRTRWGGAICERAMNEVDPLWTWPQLFWIRQNEPEVWQKIAFLLFPKDYVRHRLAPSLLSDTIDPAGTLLFDPDAELWIEEFVHDLDLPMSALPPIHAPETIAGFVSQSSATDSGLLAGTPVITGTTDTAAEVLGSGAFRPGQAIVKLSSVGRIMLVMEQPLVDPHCLNYRHVLSNLWYPGSVTKHGAGAYRWLRQALWPELDGRGTYNEMDKAAGQIPAGCDGLFFQPHLSGEYAPQWDPSLRASFVGFTIRHGRAHFTRAVLEGVAFQIRSALDQLLSIGGRYNEIRLIGGGANGRLWGQIMSNVLGCELLVPAERSAAFGAGILAGKSMNFYPSDVDGLDELIKISQRFLPISSSRSKYDQLYDIFKQIDATLAGVSHQIEELQNFS
jgi:xylulokinase